MKKTKQPIPVLVALNKSVISRTRKLSGIFRASAESGRLELRILDEGWRLTPEKVDAEIARGIRGFIVGAASVSKAIEHIGRLGLPLVTISLPCKAYRNACAIQSGNREIAQTAARTLLNAKSTGSFAYYPAHGDPDWSKERERQFFRALGDRRHVLTLSPDKAAEELRGLPRPVGVLAANDSYAAELIGLCLKNGLRVPEDVSVIGVDNEEVLCESTTPAISSIEPDFEREGYEAARTIIQLLDKRPVPSHVDCGIRRIALRESTASQNYADALVNRAMDYISGKATTGIAVRDVCARLRVSRRLLDLRFRQIRKTTPHEAIIDCKLNALKKELARSKLPIAIVCKRCGFGSENHPKKLFRDRYGMTMRDYRASRSAKPAPSQSTCAGRSPMVKSLTTFAPATGTAKRCVAPDVSGRDSATKRSST